MYTMDYDSAIKKWNHAICSNMDGPRTYCAKWNKSDRERQMSFDFNYMWNLKTKQTNKPARSTLTDTESILIAAKWEGC